MYEINEFMKDRKKSTIYNVQVKLLSSGIKFKKIFNIFILISNSDNK